MGDRRDGYLISGVNPFWRWAVALDRQREVPACVFFTRRGAECFLASARADLPWADMVLLRRRRLIRVEIVEVYRGGR